MDCVVLFVLFEYDSVVVAVELYDWLQLLYILHNHRSVRIVANCHCTEVLHELPYILNAQWAQADNPQSCGTLNRKLKLPCVSSDSVELVERIRKGVDEISLPLNIKEVVALLLQTLGYLLFNFPFEGVEVHVVGRILYVELVVVAFCVVLLLVQIDEAIYKTEKRVYLFPDDPLTSWFGWYQTVLLPPEPFSQVIFTILVSYRVSLLIERSPIDVS